jgi:DNA anti-recombination protein RmuC
MADDNKVAIHLVMEGAAKVESDAHKFAASVRSIGQEAEKVQKSASSFMSLAADISHVGSSAFITVQGFKAMTAPVADAARALIHARVAADQMRQSMSAVFGDQAIGNTQFAKTAAQPLNSHTSP